MLKTTTLKVNHNCDTCPSREKGIFCELEKAGLDRMAVTKSMSTYKKGQNLFLEGNPAFGIFCISSGKIKVTRAGGDGKESIVRIAGPGDLLGHLSLYNSDSLFVSATALEDATVCFLDKKFILGFMKEQPSVAFNMIQKLTHDLEKAEGRNASMSQKTARERLAELLLNFSDNYGIKEENRIKLDIKLNRDEMASIVGTAHETIIRLISELKEEKILEQEGKVLYVIDQEKLIKFANP